MACMQQVTTSQFPNQVVPEQQSLVVMKKLLAIAVSGITYLRGIFPDKAYGSKYLAGQKVMILREERSCPGASQIVQWMTGCFEAIQKNYLRTVIMSIYTDPDNPQKVTECYQFRIQYTAEGAQMDFESSNNDNKVSSMPCNDTKKASILLVRKLYTLMQNLGPLPDHICLNMKLDYYENVTPQDYQPPGFKEADSDTLEFGKEMVELTMGQVATPFHSLKVDMSTERHRLEQVKAHVIEDVEKSDSEDGNLDNTGKSVIQLSIHEKTESWEKATEMDTEEKKSPGVDKTRRTRSGRNIQSVKVSQYEIPSSQDTPSTSEARKRRKFSEPKERF
uniref:HORMA domain-containing protein 1 isoform X1 n=1 Tax=Gasterosteus aculeatus aculeatus TaxID=481459 RepID=UPI001A980124|nr:HORMA domain-containing protein 1 isoform X1 [Gasterosteus aculeatus aculeatus]